MPEILDEINRKVNGLGASLGATIIFALILSLTTRHEFVPIIGNTVVEIWEFINENADIDGPQFKNQP